MKARLIRCLALCLALTLLFSTAAFAAQMLDETMVLGVAEVSVSGQRLRAEPSNGAEALTAVNAGSQVLVLEKTGGWYLACYDGVIGYIRADYLTFRTVGAVTLGTGYAKYNSVNVRTLPSLDAPVAAALSYNTAVNVTGIINGWYRIADASGEDIGFVRSDLLVLETLPTDAEEQKMLDTGDLELSDLAEIYVTRTPENNIVIVTQEGSVVVEAAPPAEDQPDFSDASMDKAVEVINYAFSFIGTPYVWAANGPDAFDCSGFVKYVYSHFGYSMNRVANDMYYRDGVAVDRANLQPGDVIFFGNTYASSETATHVGIYIGNDQFVHASSSKGVTVSQLSSEYYSTRFVGGKRMIDD